MNPELISMTVGGEPLETTPKRREREEHPHPARGAFQIEVRSFLKMLSKSQRKFERDRNVNHDVKVASLMIFYEVWGFSDASLGLFLTAEND